MATALSVTALPAGAATIAVDSTADDFDAGANGNCTLREAVLAANTNATVDGCAAGEVAAVAVDVITVPAGTFVLTVGPRGDDAGEHGDLDLTEDVEVRGVDAAVTTIDADRIDRIFHVHGGVEAVLSGLEVRGGDAGSGNGGGINNDGDLTLDEVTVVDNRADGSGGGVRNSGQLTVRSSLLEANFSPSHGGGVDNHGDSAFENTTVSGNDGGVEGGGLYNLGGHSMSVVHCTVTGNLATTGAALHNAGDLTASNNLIDGPCSGIVNTTGGGNLESPGDTCGLGPSDLVAIADPLLGPLADNGGPTRTHALLAGSPAVDAALAGDCPASDQRGVIRPIDGDGDAQADCDIGAFEAPNTLDSIFADGFESGDMSFWS